MPALDLWLKFDDASGAGSCVDSSINGRNGTPFNGVTLGVAGKIGLAASFDGVNDYVKVPRWAGLNGNVRTMMAWVNIPAGFSVNCNLFGDSQGFTGGCCVQGVTGTSNVVAQIVDNASAFSNAQCTTSLTANTWYHVAATFDGSVPKIYINGVNEATGSSITSTNATLDFMVGAGNSGTPTAFANVKLDDLRVYPSVLTATEILNIYKGKLPFISKNAIL